MRSTVFYVLLSVLHCYLNFLLLNALLNVDIFDHGHSLATQIKYYVST